MYKTEQHPTKVVIAKGTGEWFEFKDPDKEIEGGSIIEVQGTEFLTSESVWRTDEGCSICLLFDA